MIYLDYTANAPVEPRVLEAFCRAERECVGNANARHGAGREAAGAMARAAEALQLAWAEREARFNRVLALNRKLRAALSQRGGVTVHSPHSAIPHILNLGVEGIRGAAFRDALAERGVCVSVKSACSVENTPSRAVYAVTRNRRQALESWRISLSHLTTEAELEDFIRIFDEVREELKP